MQRPRQAFACLQSRLFACYESTTAILAGLEGLSLPFSYSEVSNPVSFFLLTTTGMD